MPRNGRSRRRLAPSIQRAHARVQRAWWGSILHGVLLVVLGVHLLRAEEPRWVLGSLCLAGAFVMPTLGRSAYRGNSFSALLLFASAAVPPAAALLLGRSPELVLPGVPLAVLYLYGIKGATGLRGRRATGRERARVEGG